MVYVDTHADALDVLTFFSDHSVAPDSLIFCHLDTVCCDIAVHEAILQAGAYISYDAATLGSGTATQMLNRGHLGHLLLSSSLPDAGTPFDALLNAQDDLLHRLGIDKDALDVIMRQNPANALRIKK